jgi:hypothetical protein
MGSMLAAKIVVDTAPATTGRLRSIAASPSVVRICSPLWKDVMGRWLRPRREKSASSPRPSIG